MKKIIVTMLAGIILTAFSNPVNVSPASTDVVEITGYKLRNEKIDLTDFNLWVVTSEDVFERDFEPEHDSVLKPRFDEQMVLAAKVETVHNAYRVKFKKTELVNGTLNVYFNVKREGSPETVKVPVSMVAVPKDKSMKKVNFYHDNLLVKTVPIVTVY